MCLKHRKEVELSPPCPPVLSLLRPDSGCSSSVSTSKQGMVQMEGRRAAVRAWANQPLSAADADVWEIMEKNEQQFRGIELIESKNFRGQERARGSWEALDEQVTLHPPPSASPSSPSPSSASPSFPLPASTSSPVSVSFSHRAVPGRVGPGPGFRGLAPGRCVTGPKLTLNLNLYPGQILPYAVQFLCGLPKQDLPTATFS